MKPFIESTWVESGFTTRKVTIIYWGRILKVLVPLALVVGLGIYVF